jgi:hypothetical protein
MEFQATDEFWSLDDPRVQYQTKTLLKVEEEEM